MSTESEDTDSFRTLTKIKNQIDILEKHQHIELLKILKKNAAVKLNENKSGIFVNLSYLPKETLDEILKYLSFVKCQENSINNIEQIQGEFKNMMEKEDKDNLSYTISLNTKK